MRHFIQDTTGNVVTLKGTTVKGYGHEVTYDSVEMAVSTLIVAGFREFSNAGGYAAM